MTTYRTRSENAELTYNIRLNGRISASFRRGDWAEDFAYNLKSDYPGTTVELFSGKDCILRLLPVEASFPTFSHVIASGSSGRAR